MDKQELTKLLNRQLPRLEKMRLLVSFLSENKEKLSDEDFIVFLKRYIYMVTEEYENSRDLSVAADYSFSLLFLCEKLIRVTKTWECTPLIEKTVSLLNDFPREDDAAIKKWKFETWSKIAEIYSDTNRYRQSLDSYTEALKYSSSSENFDAEDFFYCMARTGKYLGIKNWKFIKKLIQSYWVNPPASIEKFIDNVRSSSIQTDPVENTEKYLKIKDELDEKIYNATKNDPRGMGHCFIYWSEKERILKDDYGIEWHSPSALNPRVLFD